MIVIIIVIIIVFIVVIFILIVRKTRGLCEQALLPAPDHGAPGRLSGGLGCSADLSGFSGFVESRV